MFGATSGLISCFVQGSLNVSLICIYFSLVFRVLELQLYETLRHIEPVLAALADLVA